MLRFIVRRVNEWGDAINFDGEESRGVREFFLALAKETAFSILVHPNTLTTPSSDAKANRLLNFDAVDRVVDRSQPKRVVGPPHPPRAIQVHAGSVEHGEGHVLGHA